MPTNYTLKRRIGSMKTNGSSQWVKFIQVGDRFRWDTPQLDVSNQSFAAYTNVTLSVAPGVRCVAFGNVAAGTGPSFINIRPTDANDGVPTNIAAATTASPLSSIGIQATGATPVAVTGQWRELTDTSAQVAIGGNTTAATYLTTAGWEDTRGRVS
jgi:hypothetical protein